MPKFELIKLLIYFAILFLEIEGYRNSWRKYKESNYNDTYSEKTTFKAPKGLALTGYLASVIDYSYIVSYHYKESGRLFCSGFAISQYWTVSVPNCFHIPKHYYRNRENKKISKRKTKKYPYGYLTLKEATSLKAPQYSNEDLEELRDIISLKPEYVVILTVFDKSYIPCKTKNARIGTKIILHTRYKIPSHDAEIALVKVSDSLTNVFDVKIPTIAPINIKGAEHASCQVAGYGTLKLNRSMYSSPMLSIIDVEVFSPSICELISKTYNVVINADPSNYVCSYNKKYRYGSPLSQGDSGAPLICENKIVGISQWVFSAIPGYLSFGPSQPTPHLYAKLDIYRDWIFQHANDTNRKQFSKERLKRKNNTIALSSAYNMRIIILIYLFHYYVYKTYCT